VLDRLINYIFNNTLSRDELFRVISQYGKKIAENAYIKGYWTRDADLKRSRKSLNLRLKHEYEENLIKQENDKKLN